MGMENTKSTLREKRVQTFRRRGEATNRASYYEQKIFQAIRHSDVET